MKIITLRAAAAALLVLLSLLVAPLVRAQQTPLPASDAADPAVRPHASNKWRIAFDERAKSDGTITLRVWPAAADPILIEVPIKDGVSENHIAQAVRDAIGTRLGKGYHVETDDGEDVLVKARHGTKDFGLDLVSNTVRDVDIKLRRE